MGLQEGRTAFTTVYSFATELRSILSASDAAFVDSQLLRESINPAGLDIWGTNETNDAGGNADALPLYSEVFPDAGPETVCVNSDFDFDIGVISTSVSIDQLSLDQATTPLGGQVSADLWLTNSGAAQDAVVAATVRDAFGQTLVDGLQLGMLHDLSGPSQVSFEWDSSGLPVGD